MQNRSRKFLFIFYCLLVFAPPVFSQQNDIYLFIDSTTIIGKISDNKVYVSETEVAYRVQGNLIFEGDSTAKAQILFSVNAKNILSNKVGLIYENDFKTIQYITQKSTFYLGDYPIDKEHEKLLTIETKNDSLFDVISGISGEQIGTIEGKFTSQAEIVAAAHIYVKHYRLDAAVHAAMRLLNADSSGTGGYGYVRPVVDRGPYYEWVWDGHTLKPAWGYRPEDEWVFDGKYLKPAWSADPQTEWIWDGTMLKPSWENSLQNQWIWDQGILKPFWDSNPDLQWKYEDGVMRPMWNFDQFRQYQVEGDVPLPVLTLIIIGKADR